MPDETRISSAVICCRALVVRKLPVGAKRLQQGGAHALLVRAAFGCRNGVAVGLREAVLVGEPGDGPLDAAMPAFLLNPPGEQVLRDRRQPLDARRQEVLEPAGEMEDGLLRHVRCAFQQLGRAGPADFHAAEQIGLGAGHLENADGLEMRALLENRRVRPEADRGAAPVADGAEVFKAAQRRAFGEGLPVKPAAARDLDLQMLRKRVHDRDADAVKAATGRVDVRVEFAAGVERGHDDFQRRLAGIFRVRVHGDAAAVVGDAQRAVGLQLHLDVARMARHRLVHGVVDHLGEEVVHGLLVRAADIHARAAANGLQPLQHLDIGRGIALAGLLHGQAGDIRLGRIALLSAAEKVACHGRVLLAHA